MKQFIKVYKIIGLKLIYDLQIAIMVEVIITFSLQLKQAIKVIYQTTFSAVT